jgi:hypothetical protein
LRDHREENSTKSFTTPLNPRRQPLGRCPHRQQFPVRQFGRTTHQFSGVGCQGSEPDRPVKPMHQHLLMTRPETHQNLIHIPKNNTDAPNIKPEQPHKRHEVSRDAMPRPHPHRIRDIPRYLEQGSVFSFRTSPVATKTDNRRLFLETTGIEPVTPCLQSRCSPS